MKWRKAIAAVAIGASMFGVAACGDDNPDEVDEEISEEKGEVQDEVEEEKEQITDDL